MKVDTHGKLLPSPEQWLTLVDLLNERASSHPSHVVFRFLADGESESGCLTYFTLDRQARAIAAQLQYLTAMGERALLLYQPGLEFIPAFLGCLYSGVIAVPAYPPRPNQKLDRLQAIIRDAQAAIILTTTNQLADIQKRFAAEPEIQLHLQWLATDGVSEEWSAQWQPPALKPEKDLAFLQYTSGSTGDPKGVMITHHNLLHNQRVIQNAFGHTQATRFVSWLPVFHDMGLVGNILQPLYIGCSATLLSPVHFLQYPVRWLRAISAYQGTTSGGPNFAYELCIQRVKSEDIPTLDLSSWNMAFNGAEPVRATTLERFAERFKPCRFRPQAFYPCYGMAETTLLVTGGSRDQCPTIQSVDAAALEQNQVLPCPPEPPSISRVSQLVSCGYPWLDLEVKIVHPQSLKPLTEGKVGEIWVRGGSVAAGYWNRPQQSQEIFQASPASSGNGKFLRTGDLGFFWQGELFVTGRLKDVIIIRGQNYYPQDIELTVEQSHSALLPSGCAAFTVAIQEENKLVIVQEVKRTALRNLDIRAILGNIREAITAQYALEAPHAILLVKPGQVPKTSSGKVQRYACRRAFLEERLYRVEPSNVTKLEK